MLTDKNTARENKEFLKENIGRLLLKFAIPVILSMLVTEMYNMVDSLFVGQFVGAKGLGALTIAFPVQRLFSSLAMLVAIGTSTAISRNLGENDYSKVRKIVPNAIIVLVAIMVFFILTILIFNHDVIIKLGSSDNIFPYAKTYINIILLGVVFQGLSILMSYILTSFGEAKVILVSTSIGAIFNFIIDYLLVVIFNFGIGGAAIATVISQIVAFVYTLMKFLKIKKEMNLKFEVEIDKNIYKEIIYVGFSTFIVEVSDAVVAVFLNKILLEIGGDGAIVALGLITRVSMFLFITVIGISSAMQPIAAYNFGAGSNDRVKKIVKLSVKTVTISSIILWAAAMIFAKQMIGIFVNDAEIIKYTARAFRIVILLFPFIGTYYVAIYYYQAMGMARLSLLLSIFRQIIIFIPIVYIMVYWLELGVLGAWISYPISDIISFGISLIYIKCYQVEDIVEEKVNAKRGAIIT
ncbi:MULTISPECIES: MATE family efflux transporter [Clostridium]|uniref:Multidrug export protein MepA n=2 Tax=Clostridium TaxID=1485 RepID=A0A151AR04_9CLOT|nr:MULTISPECIES: MATE family efflux transporter [Clostridium]KYH30010.1 multidrug export protein MepA [Clostridium colicanis DSM 13634]MBE6044215.1 MATE family efflux transporter [Clostridium thermopalmarium]PRR75891.1 Multidrug export protein MepA [Clostridium thermopalmarium DSM 5974]PVZ24469.1 putative MATE family efflux protein [Clostridium thermopalmarium DSM 5974]